MGLKEKPPQEGEGLREVHRSTCSEVWHLSGAGAHATDRHFWGNPKIHRGQSDGLNTFSHPQFKLVKWLTQKVLPAAESWQMTGQANTVM